MNLKKIFTIMLCLFSFSSLAFGADATFDHSLDYRITFESSEHESTTIQPARIEGIKNLAGIPYLAFTSPASIKPVEGYVLLSSVRAILPSSGPGLQTSGAIQYSSQVNSSQ